ncbi:stage II sporulation protein R [Oscillospiraceae bacterium PP1C4]
MKRFMSRLDFAVLLGVVFSVLLANIAAFGQECDAIRQDVVRLHILANSDNEIDQSVKLKVRDRILSDVGSVFAAPQNKNDAKMVAEENLSAIKLAAQTELRENGFNEQVSVELCNMYFTTRQYGTLSLPAGNYDAVRVTIGAGAGKNWWCVMYPPMCVSAALAECHEEMEEIVRLNGEAMFVPKLAVVELFEDLTHSQK